MILSFLLLLHGWMINGVAVRSGMEKTVMRLAELYYILLIGIFYVALLH